MRKLAVLAMMIAIASVMAAPMASANDYHHWWGIHGTYFMTATGGCLHSTLGFDLTNLTPVPGSVVWGASIMAQAIWTFERGGTGTVSGTNYVVDFPPGAPALAGTPALSGPIARQNPISFSFTYELTEDGVITVYPPSPQPAVVGMISKDHKTLTLGNANHIQPNPPSLSSAICNIGRVLIRVEEEDE